MALVLAGGCLSIGTQEKRLVQVQADSINAALESARKYAAPENLAELRRQVKSRFPTLSEDDLLRIDLGWQLLSIGREQSAHVVVTFVPRNTAVPAKSIADYAAELVRADLDTARAKQAPRGLTQSTS
jgi:hypothetical protein